MGNKDKDQEVSVRVCSFNDFFEKEAVYPVAIDTYQRPYVWDESKIEELVDDLTEYLNYTNGLPYYMGTVLLHRDDKERKLFIIDGQQRLTTLSILYYVLYGKLSNGGKMAMEYNSPLSAKNIKIAQGIFEKKKEAFKEQADLLFSSINITFITTLEEDTAFTFFDTQNNRGVKLYPTDLLKSYHLRALGSGENLDIQRSCADRWERIQNYSGLFGQNEDFAAQLFSRILWRSRVWRGQRAISRESESDILCEFQKNTLRSESPDEVPLYPNQNNTLGQKLIVRTDRGYEIKSADSNATDKSVHLPFTLRQPLTKGLGFFLFSEKYAELVYCLFRDNKIGDYEVMAFRAFYEQVWTEISIYLKELFVLAVVMYYDKFESVKLLEFALWLDHALGAVRIQKQSVVKESPLKFLKETDNNLLDVISQAFRPEEVISFLKSLGNIKEIYQNEKIIAGKGVQGVYKSNVLSYYGKTDFSEKESWINESFAKEKRDMGCK